MAVQSSRYDATGAFTGSPVRYFLTQPRVILHYLRLAFWPTGLCFDFNFPILETWAQVLPSLVYMLALGIAVVFGLSRRKAWAWPGVAFLLALAPSSSVVPLAAVSEEYRMYLALAAVASAVVLGAHTLIRRWTPPGKVRTMTFRGAAGLTLAAVLGLVILTQERNRVYATPGGVWLDVIQKGRAGTRAYWNLAMACDEREDFDAAIRFADEVVARNPGMGVYEDLARSRLRKGDAASAERYLRHALAPRMDQSTGDRPVAVRHAAQLVMILKMQGRATEAQSLAAEHCERVRATLGDDHPWTRELMAIRDGGAADADTIGRER
jgi:hypothetical protein